MSGENVDLAKQRLSDLLQRSGVPVNSWSHDSPDALDQLLRELHAAEAVLVWDKERKPTRLVKVVGVNVWHTDDQGDLYLLREDRQVFADGRIRQHRRLAASITEQLKTREAPLSGARRALREELGITEKISLDRNGGFRETRLLPLFPGLRSIYDIFLFSAGLNQQYFKPGGYIEEQPHKTIYFVWQKQPQSAASPC